MCTLFDAHTLPSDASQPDNIFEVETTALAHYAGKTRAVVTKRGT